LQTGGKGSHISVHNPTSGAIADQPSRISSGPPHCDRYLEIVVFHHSLQAVFDEGGPQFSVLLTTYDNSKVPLFYGGCAYIPEEDELFITSNLLAPSNPNHLAHVLISRVKLFRDNNGQVQSVAHWKLRTPGEMGMPGGAVGHKIPNSAQSVVTYCSQGDFVTPSGLFQNVPGRPPKRLVTSWCGTKFGSVFSVAVHTTVEGHEAYWFVDAGSRGYEAGFRERPMLPAAVWRYYPFSGDLRMMTDDVTSPWGIAISPDGATLYVTDSNPVRDDSGRVKWDM